MSVSLETILSTSFLVPLGDPLKPNCYWGLNVMLWGSPGIGKSARVRSAAAKAGLPTEVVIAATRQPEDVSGAAFPDGQGGVNIKTLLPGVQRLIKDEQGVLFLDELSCARPAVQAAFLGVVLDRRVGDDMLPPGIRVLAAANPPEEAAGGWDLEPPMANRFCHVNVPAPVVAEWTAWFLSQSSGRVEDVEMGEKKVQEGWGENWPAVQGLVSGFLQDRSSALYSMPKEGSKDRSRAWPSPRTWEMAARSMATVRCLFPLPTGKPLSDEQKKEHARKTATHDILMSTLLEGCIGRGVAAEFINWVKAADLPSPSDVLKFGYVVDKRRLDIAMAAYSSMISYVLTKPTRDEKVALASLAWTRLHELSKQGLADMAIPNIQAMISNDLGTRAGKKEVNDAMRPLLMDFIKRGLEKYMIEDK